MFTSGLGRKLHLAAVLADTSLWAVVTAAVTAVLYLSTMQLGVNGSQCAYTTDVGEIQNALPRWGTIHYPGYPFYCLLGSPFVNLLRLVGVVPAAGSSLYSAMWGVVTALLLFAVARELGAGPLWAALGAIAAMLSTSLWMDSSLAETHTMGTALLLGILYFALRLVRHGGQRNLIGLALAFSLGVTHQRTILFLAPAVLLLIWPRWAEIKRGLLRAMALASLGPLTYLYLPIRAWQGAAWTFGAVGTWQGFLQIFLDTKVERVVAMPQELSGWLARAKVLLGLLHEDLWLPVLALGLAALWLVPWRRGARRCSLALALAWLPAIPLSLLIWEGTVSDALLAAKLPVVLLAGAGLALVSQALCNMDRRATPAAAICLILVIGMEVHLHRPVVLAVTRDAEAERIIAIAEQVAQPQGGPPTTFMAPWGHTYWALAYAQAYNSRLQGLTLVDHNADLATIARRERLLTLQDTLYPYPLSWWDERLGHAHLSSPAPGIVAISPMAAGSDGVPAGPALDMENGVRILSVEVEPAGKGRWVLRVHWQAYRKVDTDYSVAVHALALDPPRGPEDILAQADCLHPVCGWYPTSRWEPGEVVADTYLLSVPEGSQPVAVRAAMYRVLPGGGFANSPWLTLPLP